MMMVRWLVLAGLAVIVSWSVAASYLWCYWSNVCPAEEWRLLQWWFIAPYFRANWYVTILFIGSALVPTGCIAVIAAIGFCMTGRRRLRRPLFGGLKPIEAGVTDNHGHAAWPSVAAMLKAHGCKRPGRAVVVMGEARRIDLEPVACVPFDSGDSDTWGMGGQAKLLMHDPKSGLSASPHSFWCIGTGGMKSMHAISTQYHWTGSIITFDPSCEIGGMVRKWREKMGQRVVFIGKNAGQQGIAALDCIQPDKPDASSRILSMTASICGEETGRNDKNSVFSSAGRNLIACLLAHMMYDKSIPDHMRTMETLVEGITIPEDEMQLKLREIHKSSDSIQAQRLAGIVMGTHRETFSGAYFSATQFAGWLLDPENAKLLSGTLKPSEILKGGLSIYIQIPTGSLIYVPGPGRVITDAIVSAVLQAEGKYTDSMLLQADEARLLGNMKSIEVVLLQGRKYGLVLNMIYTSINDMKRVWTEDGMETWMDNVEWCGFASVSSKTAQWLSAELGKRGVMAISEGSNRGVSGQAMGTGSRSRGSNTSFHEISRNLINPDEFKDCRRDEAFIVHRTGRPYRCGLAPWFRRPEMIAEITQTIYRKEEEAA